MGIYSDGIIYGIRVIQKNVDENGELSNEYITIYEKISNKAISKNIIKEAQETYNTLNMLKKQNNYRFFIYSNCSTTYSKEDTPFMMWENIDKNDFLEL